MLRITLHQMGQPERLFLADSLSAERVEEVGFLEVERQIDLRPDWRQRLRRHARCNIVTSRARINKSLVPKRFDEIQPR